MSPRPFHESLSNYHQKINSNPLKKKKAEFLKNSVLLTRLLERRLWRRRRIPGALAILRSTADLVLGSRTLVLGTRTVVLGTRARAVVLGTSPGPTPTSTGQLRGAAPNGRRTLPRRWRRRLWRWRRRWLGQKLRPESHDPRLPGTRGPWVPGW